VAHVRNVGVAGLGAMGRVVARALAEGQVPGARLAAVSESVGANPFPAPNLDFAGLAAACDLVCECLPAVAVPDLARACFAAGTDMVVITSAALLIHPEILAAERASRILVPSGALAGMDGVRALAAAGAVTAARLTSTKPPAGFGRDDITERTRLFSGNALEAARAYPANVNVAATLTLASGLAPQEVEVEIWADPAARGNAHEIRVESAFSTITARVEGQPDPANPKTSMLAARSVIAALRAMGAATAVV
jgi:aspartate dehydrogenase